MFRSNQLVASVDGGTPAGGGAVGADERLAELDLRDVAPSSADDERTRRGRGTGAIRVLIVEDDPAMSLMAATLLGQQGDAFEVTHVSTLADGRTAHLRAPFDVVLLDLGLPDAVSPLLSVDEVASWQPEPCVIVLTGNSEPGLSVDALRGGADDFLLKDGLTGDRLVTTVRHGLERHRRSARQAARAAELVQRLEDLDSYVGAISHDLRSPMGTAESMLSILSARRHELPEEQVRALLGAAESQVRKAREFAEELLADAVAGSERRTELDLARVVRDAVLLAGGVAAPVVEVGLLPSGLWGREVALTQVMTNLIRNAVAFSSAGAGSVRVHGGRQDSIAVLVVEDDGPGVPLAERESVFEPEHSGRPGGTGLGLEVVRRHVRTHGGRVWVEDSVELGGARFVVELPIRVRDR